MEGIAHFNVYEKGFVDLDFSQLLTEHNLQKAFFFFPFPNGFY